MTWGRVPFIAWTGARPVNRYPIGWRFPVTEDHEEYFRVLKTFGTPEEIQRKLIAIDLMLESDERRRWLFRGLVTALKTFFAGVALWAAFKLLLGDILAGLGHLFGGGR